MKWMQGQPSLDGAVRIANLGTGLDLPALHLQAGAAGNK
jgi:hypothetical protein